MQRDKWFWFSLLAGYGLAVVLWAYVPGTRQAIADALAVRRIPTDLSFALGTTMTLIWGPLFCAIFILVPLAVRDSIKGKEAVTALDFLLSKSAGGKNKTTRAAILDGFSHSPLLEGIAKEFAAYFLYISDDGHATIRTTTPPSGAVVIGASRPAASCFTFERVVNKPLYLWFLNGLSYFLLGLAPVLAIWVFLQSHGLAESVWGTTARYSGIPALKTGLFTLACALLVSIAILGLTGLVSTVRSFQLGQIQSLLDRLLERDPWNDNLEQIRRAAEDVTDDVATAVKDALAEPMAALTGSQTESLEKLTAAVLDAVKKGLQEPLSNQARALESSLKSVSKAIAQIERATDRSQATLTKRLERHDKELTKQLKESMQAIAAAQQKFSKMLSSELSTYSSTLKDSVASHAVALDRMVKEGVQPFRDTTTETLAQARDDFSAAAKRLDDLKGTIDKFMDELSPILGRIADGQIAFLETLDGEATSAQIIEKSAAELNSAAMAGRDTITHLSELAGRLSEIGLVIQGSPDGKAASKHKGSKDLANAIAELKKLAEDDALPEL